MARALRDYMGTQGLPGVAVKRDSAPPQRSARSGKLRRVIEYRPHEARSDAGALTCIKTDTAQPSSMVSVWIPKEIDGIVHYCVANMPDAVPHTSTYALN